MTTLLDLRLPRTLAAQYREAAERHRQPVGFGVQPRVQDCDHTGVLDVQSFVHRPAW